MLDHPFARKGQLTQARQLLRLLIAGRRGKDACHHLHAQPFGIKTVAQLARFFLVVNDTGAQVDQHFRDIDLDRANIITGPTERRGVGQRTSRFDPNQLRREDRANRAGVDRVVSVAAGALVDRTDVETGAATNTVERLPSNRVGQHIGTPIVE